MTIGDDILMDVIQDFRNELKVIEQKLDRLLVVEEQLKGYIKLLDSSIHQSNELEKRTRDLEITATQERERSSHALRFVDKFFAVFFALTAGGMGTLVWYLLTHTILKP
jgi:hypothetical protein